MRLGLLIYGSLDTISGGYLYDRRLVEHLKSQGDEVEVVSLTWRNYARHLGDNFSAGLAKRLRSLKVDLLLQDELNHPSVFWINQRLKGRLAHPIVAIVHHLRCLEARPAWQNRFYRQIERSYLGGVDGYIFNSQTTRQAVEVILQSPLQRPCVVAYPGGDLVPLQISKEEVRLKVERQGALQIIFVGNLIPRKGLHVLLNALALIEPGLCSLTVVGNTQVDRRYAGAIFNQVERLKLANQVSFCGVLDDWQLAEKMKACHVMAVPSSYEGFGIVYLEGMGWGLPAIATTAGAAGELITHGKDGYLISPGDAATLADHLALLAQDRALLHRLSQASRTRYLRHPTWEQSAGQIRSFLNTLLQS